MKPNPRLQATTRLPQGRIACGDIDLLPPTHARLVAVAVGLEHWTVLERAWLAAHPHWLEYERQFREALGTVKTTELGADASTAELIVSCTTPSFSFRL
jgi:hypothetical protein